MGSIAGLPREYGFFNYFWDSLLHCVGAAPGDLAHALGGAVLASSDAGWGSLHLYAVFAIRIEGISGADVAQTLVRELVREGRGQVIAAPRTSGGREYTVLSSGGAVYSAADVSFWMVEMTFLDSGLYTSDDLVDLALVEATVVQLPEP